ncbi:MAG: flavodoxin family protein [Wujia sp.]
MRVLMLNGSPRANGCTYTALTEVRKRLESHGIETELFQIGTQPVAGCIACGACKGSAKCVFDDKVNEFVSAMRDTDGLIVGSPVYYASASGQVTAFLDRAFYAGGSYMDGKPGAALVSCRRGGASAAFDQLNKYFSISNMPIVTSNYWNQVHGNTPEEVMQDEEGMQTLRILADNMAWLLQCIEAGKKSGIVVPDRDAKIRTNFIR